MKKLTLILSLVMVASFCISAPRKARRRLQLAASGAFSPLDLGAKLAMWFDASDSSTLLDASDNVCTNGAAVKTWSDKSGNGRDATQATVADQPTYQTGVRNGRAVIRTDGDDQLNISGTAGVFRNKTAGYIFIVAKDTDQTGGELNHVFIGFWRNVVHSMRVSIYGRGISDGWLGSGRRLDSDSFAGAVGPSNSGHTLIKGFSDWTNGYVRVSVSSADYISTAYSSGSGSTSDTAGAGALIFWDLAGFRSPANSEIAEIVVVNAEMTDAEITDLETYLSDKWDL